MARKANGTQRKPSSNTTPNGPSMRCVTQGRFRPARYMTPSGSTRRVQPSAGSHDGSNKTSHMAPRMNRRPGIVVRQASQAIGNPTATPKAAAATLTHSEFTSAASVLAVSACRR